MRCSLINSGAARAAGVALISCRPLDYGVKNVGAGWTSTEKLGGEACQFVTAVMDESFQRAVEEVKVLDQRPAYSVLADVYGLYKQATVGDVNIDRPGMFDLAGRGKWDGWNGKKGMSKEEAMVAYIDLVEDLKKKYGFTKSV
ncbi:acyl-CoA-binding protein-like isoform 1-T2 [Spinachia spinachia]